MRVYPNWRGGFTLIELFIALVTCLTIYGIVQVVYDKTPSRYMWHLECDKCTRCKCNNGHVHNTTICPSCIINRKKLYDKRRAVYDT